MSAYVIQAYATCRSVGGSIETALIYQLVQGDNLDAVTHDILEVQKERNGKEKEKYD